MSVVKEFREFVARGNVIDLAVAVVLGAAFGKIVTAMVDGIIMPLIGAVLPGGDGRTYEVTSLGIKLGAVLGSVVDFILVAFAIFLVVNKAMGVLNRRPPPPPTSKECPECLEQIPINAKRCRACAQLVA